MKGHVYATHSSKPPCVAKSDFLSTCSILRDAILASGLSAIELTRRSGVAYRTIFAIIHNKANPRGSTIFKIAAALGTTPRDIMAGLYDGKPKLVNAVRDMQQTWGPDAVKKGHVVLKREGDPTPIPLTPRMTDLIRLIADTLGVSDEVVIDHIQQMKKEKKGAPP